MDIAAVLVVLFVLHMKQYYRVSDGKMINRLTSRVREVVSTCQVKEEANEKFTM